MGHLHESFYPITQLQESLNHNLSYFNYIPLNSFLPYNFEANSRHHTISSINISVCISKRCVFKKNITEITLSHLTHAYMLTQSCPILCDPMDCSLPSSSVHGIFPGKNTEVGCHFLLQGDFLNQGSKPGLLYCGSLLLCRQIMYSLSHQGSPIVNA